MKKSYNPEIKSQVSVNEGFKDQILVMRLS